MVGLLAICATAATYYIPHIHTADDSWETYLLLSNSSQDTPAVCAVRLFDEFGGLLTSFDLTIDPGETQELSLRGYGAVAGTVTCPADFVSTRVGYIASESSGGGTAEFALSSTLSADPKLDMSNYYGDLTWSGFAVFNGSDETVTVTPRYFTADGLAHSGSPFPLAPNQKRVDYFENELGQPFTNLNTVMFHCDSPALTAIVISGKDNDKLLFTRSGEHADAWEVVDRYPDQSGDSFRYVGQAVTDDYLLYAVTATGTAYGFNNLVKCYDKHTGELVWETNVDYQMTATGITASTSGNHVYLYGTTTQYPDTAYAVMCLDANDGELINGRFFTPPGEFTNEYIFKKQILVAAIQDTVLSVFQGPDGVYRYLYGAELTTQIDNSTWTHDTILGDLMIYDNRYYLIRTDWNETDHVYNVLSIYHTSSSSLMGGGVVETLEDVRFDGVPTHVIADGGFAFYGYLYVILKAAIGLPVQGELGNLLDTAADLVPYRMNLSDNSFDPFLPLDGHFMTMGSTVSQFAYASANRGMCVSDSYKTVMNWAIRQRSKFMDCQIIGPQTSGDDLYVVSCHLAYENLDGPGGSNHVVKVMKTSLSNFLLKEE